MAVDRDESRTPVVVVMPKSGHSQVSTLIVDISSTFTGDISRIRQIRIVLRVKIAGLETTHRPGGGLRNAATGIEIRLNPE